MTEKHRETSLETQKCTKNPKIWLFFGDYGFLKPHLVSAPIKFMCQISAHWGDNFEHFQAQKISFLRFFKVFLEIPRSCSSIIFGLTRPTFGVNLCSKGWYMTSKNKIFGSNFGLLIGPFWQISGLKKSFFGLFESCFGVVQKLFKYCFWP